MYTLYMMLKASGEEVQKAKENKEKRIALFVSSLGQAKQFMLKHFSSIDIPLGRVLIISRGSKTVGLSGGLDLIRAAFGRIQDDGRVKLYVGDSYVQLVKFTTAGPQIESVSPYGASSFPSSPHYNDQNVSA